VREATYGQSRYEVQEFCLMSMRSWGVLGTQRRTTRSSKRRVNLELGGLVIDSFSTSCTCVLGSARMVWSGSLASGCDSASIEPSSLV
jgi:hypothetical protein